MVPEKTHYDFQGISRLAFKVRKNYADLEKKRHGRPWTKEEIMQGFVVDVGDLMREIMKQANIREGKNRSELIHCLCDCLWSVIVLANQYDINLEKEFRLSMQRLSKEINLKLK